MKEIKRYNYLNEFLKEKFGERTLKICIDGGFTCPNRDGTKGTGGCIFCSERGSGDHIKQFQTINPLSNLDDSLENFKKLDLSITKQVENYFKSYKSERANKFIAYFQNFTNTYDSIENLKIKYDSALIDNRIVALAVATRPDCINEEIVKLLKSYSDKYYVWVDLGFQTANEDTANFINRCYSNNEFSSAVKLLNNYNIDVVTHIMVGLPGETQSDLEKTVDFINKHNIQGIKIHSTYVVENTVLADLYKNKKYTPITLENYLESVVYILTHIDKDIIIHRFSGDAPKDTLIAPNWNTHKKWVLNGLNKIMTERNLFQGMYK